MTTTQTTEIAGVTIAEGDRISLITKPFCNGERLDLTENLTVLDWSPSAIFVARCGRGRYCFSRDIIRAAEVAR